MGDAWRHWKSADAGTKSARVPHEGAPAFSTRAGNFGTCGFLGGAGRRRREPRAGGAPALPSNRGRRGDVRASERGGWGGSGGPGPAAPPKARIATLPAPPRPGRASGRRASPRAGGGGGSGSARPAPRRPASSTSRAPPEEPGPPAARALAPAPGPGCWGVPCRPPWGRPRRGGAMASESVRVVVRCRPMNQRGKELNCRPVVTVDSARGQCFIQNPGAADWPPSSSPSTAPPLRTTPPPSRFTTKSPTRWWRWGPRSRGDPLGGTWGPSESLGAGMTPGRAGKALLEGAAGGQQQAEDFRPLWRQLEATGNVCPGSPTALGAKAGSPPSFRRSPQELQPHATTCPPPSPGSLRTPPENSGLPSLPFSSLRYSVREPWPPSFCPQHEEPSPSSPRSSFLRGITSGYSLYICVCVWRESHLCRGCWPGPVWARKPLEWKARQFSPRRRAFAFFTLLMLRSSLELQGKGGSHITDGGD